MEEEREGGRDLHIMFSGFREEVRSVPDQLLAYTRSKHYLHATELLNNSGEWLDASCVACPRACNVRGSVNVCVCGCGAVARMEGELKDIEALKDLRVELISQKEVS